MQDLIGEGDRVVLRFALHGKHEGIFQGRPGTGREVTLKIIAILRIADDKIAERWGRAEIVGLGGDAAGASAAAAVI